MFSVHTTPEEFENGGYTLKAHQMFSVHTTPEEFKNATIILDLCLKKIRSGKSHNLRDVVVFEKFCFRYFFCPHENEKPAFLNSCGLKSVFEKHRFRDRLVWTVGLTVVDIEIKLFFEFLRRNADGALTFHLEPKQNLHTAH